MVSAVAHIQETMFVLGQRAGLSVVRGALRPFGTWVIPSVKRGSPYWSTLWYVEQSLDERTGQISGPKFLDVVRAEPWQQAGPHYDVAIVHHDLIDLPTRNAVVEGEPHVLATVVPNWGAVLSVHRLRAIADETDQRRALRRLAINAFGRILELPGAKRTTDVAETNGVQACMNACALRLAVDVPSLLELATAEEASLTIFCEPCTDNLLDHIVTTHVSAN